MNTTVADVMTRRVLAAREQAGFKQIVAIMRANRVSALPVLDGHNRVIGVVSEADLLIKEASAAARPAGWRWLLPDTGRKAAAVTARNLMTSPAVTIGADASVVEAAALMSGRRIKRVPVVDASGCLIGIVSRVDLLSVYSREDHAIRDEILYDLIRGEFGLDPGVFVLQVNSGVVTITGQAESREAASRLLAAIQHVEGVVDVRDRLSHPHEDPLGQGTTIALGSPQKG